MAQKLLFVDDERTIRVTLPAILHGAGFEVTVASSVPEALMLIHNERFNILLSDLNIGEPGDGFTVVSAMRRTQPEASTFILTGYPDFQSALLAIRNQVDDYFTKPADINKLISTLREKGPRPRAIRSVPPKRVSDIIRENTKDIVKLWMARVDGNPELSAIEMSQNTRIDHVPRLLNDLADRVERQSEAEDRLAIESAIQHGRQRQRVGYTIPMLLVESAMLDHAIAEILQRHLLAIDISMLISDMQRVSAGIHCAMQTAVKAFLDPIPETVLLNSRQVSRRS